MVRFAVVGTNFITGFMVNAGKNCAGFELVGVHSRSAQRAREVADKWGARLCFTDLDALAASPEIDAVYIATPNYCHKDYAIKFLAANKHVLCEKPIAANARELEEMMAAAKKHGVVLMEALRSAFNPDFLLIKKSLPKLGTLRRAVFSCCSYSSRYDDFKKGVIRNAFIPELANGALMDMGVYCVNYMVGLFGAPESVTASTIKLHNGVDGLGTITATYKTMLATLFYGKISHSANFNEIQGENGYMVIERLNAPEKVTIYYNDKTTEELPIQGTPFRQDMQFELSYFIDRIKKADGRESSQNERSLLSLNVMDKARELLGIRFPQNDR